MEKVLTSTVGTNADLWPNVLDLYAKSGQTIADVTYGRGGFWRDVDLESRGLKLLASDLKTGTDFRSLPYDPASIDGLVLDPPYTHGCVSHAEMQDYYNNASAGGGHAAVMRLYAGAILEAARVLKKKGLIFVKCQDEMANGQCWSHAELMEILETFGFKLVDLFVLMQEGLPMMRHPYQLSARKNHSYLIVGQFRG